MTTIKIGNQEVELAAAKILDQDAFEGARGEATAAHRALSAAIKEAEEVEGPFDRDESGNLTFRGEKLRDSNQAGIFVNPTDLANINRILSQHFVSKDELREALAAGAGVAHLDYYSQVNRLRESLAALIEKGAPDA